MRSRQSASFTFTKASRTSRGRQRCYERSLKVKRTWAEYRALAAPTNRASERKTIWRDMPSFSGHRLVNLHVRTGSPTLFVLSTADSWCNSAYVGAADSSRARKKRPTAELRSRLSVLPSFTLPAPYSSYICDISPDLEQSRSRQLALSKGIFRKCHCTYENAGCFAELHPDVLIYR